jgi:hypothetical protein
MAENSWQTQRRGNEIVAKFIVLLTVLGCQPASSEPAQPDAGACFGSAPVLDHGTCRRCSENLECKSDVCLSDGSCALESDVAYVMPGDKLAPALATGRRYLKLSGYIDSSITIGGGRVVTIVGDPDTVWTRSALGGPVLTVEGDGTFVQLYHLIIADQHDQRVFAVDVPPSGFPTLIIDHCSIDDNIGGGISAASGSVTITNSQFAHNRGGGVSLDGHVNFGIVGNLFLGNGGPDSVTGGLSLAVYESPSRLDHNTFDDNLASEGVGSAIYCVAGSLVGVGNTFVGGLQPGDIGPEGTPCRFSENE